MKKLTGLLLALCFIIHATAQQKPTDMDKSPMDVSYCPQNYPILKMNGKAEESAVARVLYSRPQKAGRVIFGGIVKYGEVWRMGANEATEIEFYRNVKINNKTIMKGRYSMYAICGETKWTLIFNTEKDVWGLLYNPRKDVLRIDVPVQQNEEVVEAFTMYFEDVSGGANLNILWDNVKVTLPLNY